MELTEAMAACKGLRSLLGARTIHGRMLALGLDSIVYLQNHLLVLYAHCDSLLDCTQVYRAIEHPNVFTWNGLITGLSNSGRLVDARKVFDEMPVRDVVSWNAMMTAYFRHGMCIECLGVFGLMVRVAGWHVEPLSFSCAMKACGGLRDGGVAVQLHGLLVKFGCGWDSFVEASVLDMYVKCGDVESARRLFERMVNPNLFCWNSMMCGCSKMCGIDAVLELFQCIPEKDIVSWNTLISSLSQHGCVDKTLSVLVEMRERGFQPNSMSYASALSACSSVCDLEWGKQLHTQIIRSWFFCDVFVGSAMIDLYAKCGSLRAARQIFDLLPTRNAVSWTSLIAGSAQLGHEDEAFELFAQMRESSVAPDDFTLATLLGACSTKQNVEYGAELHSYTIKIGYDIGVPVANALITMYSKCGSLETANRVFELMPTRDIISWTCLLTAYSQAGNVHQARLFFDQMPERNVVTWNSMLAAYIQHGYFEEGLKMYTLMLKENKIKPDWITFATVLSACSEMTVLRLGNQVIAQAVKINFDLDVSVANAIITMYCKCGRVEDARRCFNFMTEKDLVSWNSIINGYAQNGKGIQAIETFEELLKTGIDPDNISFIGVLSGCSHSGLVDKGKFYFDSMRKDYNIAPDCEHYACMVDLLGRSGLLEEAKAMVDEMPIAPSPGVWGALLGACRIHGNAKHAELAVKQLFELDSKDSGSYVLLANIYLELGRLDKVAEVRKLMRERGIRKNPGCSWIEVNSRVHVFTVDDCNHPRIENVHKKLDEVMKKIEASGYVRIAAQRYQSHHSEKLAVAFGLMTLPQWMPIDIIKNLRVCEDCHKVMKFISLVMSRELIVRDANRFHHFREGSCSCCDYW